MEQVKRDELTVSTKMPARSSETEVPGRRRALVEQMFRRMALSVHQPAPEPERMFLLVEDALRLWRDMTDPELIAAVEAGIIEAGAFMATAGLVAKVHKRAKAIPILGAPNHAPQVLEAARKWQTEWDAMTDEDREKDKAEYRAFFRGIAEKLSPGNRPDEGEIRCV